MSARKTSARSVGAEDEAWMRLALELAAKGKGRCSPNPAVGAVIVKHGKVIGSGWHRGAGRPHAEVEALRSLEEPPEGAVMYVTLEPCNHHGRTPPCSDAIIKAGVGRVVIGARDTSPKKGVRGAAALRRAGVEVVTGVLKKECGRMVEDFIKHSTTGLPFVLLKTAMTLDGKIATVSGDSKWISSERSRRMVHRLRGEVDAVMVGTDTVIADNPSLTARRGRARRNPLRVIVDGRLRIPLGSEVVKTAGETPTLVATSSGGSLKKARALEKAGVEVLVAPSKGPRIDLGRLMEELGARGVMSVMIEGAGDLAGAAVGAGVVDRVMFFVAPKLVGGTRCAVTGFEVSRMKEALRLHDVEAGVSGGDVVIEGRLGSIGVGR